MLKAHLDGNSASKKKHAPSFSYMYIFLIHHDNTFLNTLLHTLFFILRPMRIGSLHSVFFLLNHAEK